MTYHMRRKEKEIVDSNVLKKILKSVKYVTLALSMNDQPYLATLSHGYDEKHSCIYFHCAKEGKKIDYLKANNTVWGQAMLDYGYVEENATTVGQRFSSKARPLFSKNLKISRKQRSV